MAVVSAITSPSILSAVTDPVPWLWIMGREKAHPEALFLTLHHGLALRVTVKIGSLGIANQGQADTALSASIIIYLNRY